MKSPRGARSVKGILGKRLVEVVEAAEGAESRR